MSCHYGVSVDDNGMDACCWLGGDSSLERKAFGRSETWTAMMRNETIRLGHINPLYYVLHKLHPSPTEYPYSTRSCRILGATIGMPANNSVCQCQPGMYPHSQWVTECLRGSYIARRE